ncbi:MAG: endolytic transglycosylase MltG [Mariprofundales bacterium]
MPRWLIIVATLLTLLLSGGYWQVNRALHQPKRVADTTITIAHGASAQRVIHQLAQSGVVDHPLLLRIYARLDGTSSHIQSGIYHFNGDINAVTALQQLIDGQVMRFQITIPEGLRSTEILLLLANHSGVAIEQWQRAWQRIAGTEGVLLPESWRYTKPLQPRALLQRMIDAQLKLLATLEPEPSKWQRLRTIASIIEKETRIDEERPIISAVIRNRLQRHMPLQMDPTIIYGLYQIDGGFSGDITRSDLKRDTPWNSYLHKGLPPTPICHPGRASLIAAAHPASSNALYFVANGKGGHNFAATLAQHQHNVALFLQQKQQ